MDGKHTQPTLTPSLPAKGPTNHRRIASAEHLAEGQLSSNRVSWGHRWDSRTVPPGTERESNQLELPAFPLGVSVGGEGGI